MHGAALNSVAIDELSRSPLFKKKLQNAGEKEEEGEGRGKGREREREVHVIYIFVYMWHPEAAQKT